MNFFVSTFTKFGDVFDLTYGNDGEASRFFNWKKNHDMLAEAGWRTHVYDGCPGKAFLIPEPGWEAGIASGADWCVFLDDDAELHPQFVDACETYLAYLSAWDDGDTGEVVGLLSTHDLCRNATNRSHYVTRCHVIGTGYAMSKNALRIFTQWRLRRTYAEICAPRWQAHDSLVNEFSSRTYGYARHPVTSLVDALPVASSVFPERKEDEYARLSEQARLLWQTKRTREEWAAYWRT